MAQTVFSARHSMDSPEWYTPSPFVEAARRVLVAIDLDPASHAEANLTVQAVRYFTEDDDGLAQFWSGRVFLNPPGGLVPAFWKKLIASSEITAAIWIGYSLEQLQTLQNCGAATTPLDFSMCVPNRRISFVENEAKRALRLEKIRAENVKRLARGEKPKSESSGPSHANYVAYIGPDRHRFESVFSAFGAVRL